MCCRVHDGLAINDLEDIPLRCSRPIPVIASEVFSYRPECVPNALLLGSWSCTELDPSFDQQLSSRSSSKPLLRSMRAEVHDPYLSRGVIIKVLSLVMRMLSIESV